MAGGRRRRLPTLTSIRTFEAAARLGSFSAAADELLISQSAVSRQVKHLEDQVGFPLFDRHSKRVVLTDKGARCAAKVTDCFARLADAFDDLHRGETRSTINVASDGDFAQLWLLPRLRRFELTSGIDVSLTLVKDATELSRHPFDCAVFWGRGEWPGLNFQPLFTNSVFAVANAPTAAEIEAARRRGTFALADHRLIHDRSEVWWRQLATVIEGSDPERVPGPTYEGTVLCLEAAHKGHGLTVGDEVTTRPYLEDGRLVPVFDLRLPTPNSYWLLWPKEREPGATVEAFRQWIVGEANEHRQWFVDYWGQAERAGERAVPATMET